jgi:uncharacterized surface protein with fasciclin (FAS1) repeats
MNNLSIIKQRLLSLAAGVTAIAVLVPVSPASAAASNTYSPQNHLTFMYSSNSQTVPEVVGKTKSLSTLFAAVGAAGVAELLGTSNPITVFAPTNAAFDSLPPGTVESLLLPENKDQLINILSYHVVAGEYRLADVIKATLLGPVELTTLSGDPITVYRSKGMIMIETPNSTARVIRPNLRASNGVIHMINAVLLP